MCSQPMVHAIQLLRVFDRTAPNCSGERFTASSNVPLWKLRVGSAPKRLNVSRFVAVPSSRYFAVAGPKDFFERDLLSAVSFEGCAHTVRRVPEIAIALMFFEPSTAPLPPRPAWRPSCEM